MRRIELLFLGSVILLGSFFRLYHLPNTLLFLGDQGRDALIAKAILQDRDLALIGPVTSVGNMYLGPFYYYFMVPFLYLSYPDPVGPAFGVAIINVLSLVAIYFVGKVFFGKPAAIASTALYAFMPLGIKFSRFSWNPNLGAPVGLLLYLSLVYWYRTKSNKYALTSVFLFGILIQLHYVTLTTAGVIGGIWLWMLIKKQLKFSKLLLQFIMMSLLSIFMISPLIIFNQRHEQMLTRQFTSFFTSGEQHIRPVTSWQTSLKETEGRAYRIMSQAITGVKNVPYDRALTWFGIIFVAVMILKKKINEKEKPAFYILIGWLLTSIAGTALYSSSVLDHYLTYCFSIVALFWGRLLIETLKSKWTAGFALLIGLFFSVSIYKTITNISFEGNGTKTYQDTVQVSLEYLQEPYNLALLGANGDFQGMNYRYFFDVSDKKPESNESYQNLTNLIVIDELGDDNPLSVAAYEIQAPQLTNLAHRLQVNEGPRVFIYK